MQLTSGNLYWQKKSNIEKTYPYITHNKTCDVLIVGGGITGAITAYFLAKEGANVIVVEKNIIGYASTMATTALLEYQIDIDMIKLEKIIGETFTRKIYKLCLEAITKIEEISEECGKPNLFKRANTLYYSNKFIQKQTMIKECELRKNSGFDTKFIETHNTINLNNGILTKNSSGIINPYLFTQELFDYLATFENVQIFENTRIEEVKSRADNVESRTNNNFKITSDNVIFTSGFETLKYIPEAETKLYKTFTIVSKSIEKLKDMDTNFTGRDTCDPYHYIRFDNNRVIFGGEDIKLTEKLTNPKNLENIANDKYKKLYSTLQRTLCIEEIPIEFAYNGTFVDTKDTLPIIDEISGMPNCFCNLGYGANGILYSVIGANILKDAIKGYYTKDMNIFKIIR